MCQTAEWDANPDKESHMPTPNHPMMWHGVFLFLIGLVTGLQERRFKNMRMALSAHRLFDPRRRGAIP
jgi:hypothetical protein